MEDVLNKLKNIFMADKVISRGKEWPTETGHGTMPDNWVPTEELTALDKTDEVIEDDYLQYSAEAVGYSNRELQWNAYRAISNYIPEGDSVLDFGCARGDFKLFHAGEYNFDLDYTGVDMNAHLIKAGETVYENQVNLIQSDWFSLPNDLKRDWCINIGSCNLRYDADIKTSDDDHLKKTLHAMANHAQKGVVVLLTSDIVDIDDGLINRNPGDILNWAQKEFGSVAVDHSFSNDVFILVIYK
jgi:hypothetical protein